MKKTTMRKKYLYIECQPVLVRPVKKNNYGGVPDLSDDELADPQELEKLYLRREFGPVLALPVRKTQSRPRPEFDEDGFAVGAFATVDFESRKPAIDKMIYKADKLREQRKDVLIMYAIIRDRIPGLAKYKVLKLLKAGIIDMGDIQDFDTYMMAEQWLRAVRLGKQIAELEEGSRKRKVKRLNAWLDSLG